MTSIRHVVRRYLGLGLVRLLLPLFARIPIATGIPVTTSKFTAAEDGEPVNEPGFWLYLGVATALVIAGGAFAGLTIALMGQVSYNYNFKSRLPDSELTTCRSVG